MNVLNNQEFIWIDQYTVKVLNLKGNRLFAYAYIQTWTQGTIARSICYSEIATWAGCTTQAAIRAVEDLEARGLITKSQHLNEAGIMEDRYIACVNRSDRAFLLNGWMVNELGLTGSALVLYAYIYEKTCMKNDEYWRRPLSEIAATVGISERQIINILSKLTETGCLLKAKVSRRIAMPDGSWSNISYWKYNTASNPTKQKATAGNEVAKQNSVKNELSEIDQWAKSQHAIIEQIRLRKRAKIMNDQTITQHKDQQKG